MVKKFSTSQAAVDDHKLLVNSSIFVKALKPKVYILSDSSTFKYLVQELTGNGKAGCTSVSVSSTSLLSCATTFQSFHDEQLPITQNIMTYTTEAYGYQEYSPEPSFHSSDHDIGSISIPVVSDFPPWAITSNPNDHEQVPVIGSNMIYSIGDYGFQESSPELSFDSSDHHIDLISIPVASHFSQEITDYMPPTLVSKDQEFQTTRDLTSIPQQYEEMESWFWEMDSYVNNNYGSYWLEPVMPPEVCAFDCDLSAIMRSSEF